MQPRLSYTIWFTQRTGSTLLCQALELDTINLSLPAPSLIPTADEISEVWVERFREECQKGWTNRGW